MSHSLAFMSMPGGMEWLLILLVALLIFGKNLPQVMRDLGRSFRSFRDSMGLGEDLRKDLSNPFQWDQEDPNRLHPPLARPDPHSGSHIPPLPELEQSSHQNHSDSAAEVGPQTQPKPKPLPIAEDFARTPGAEESDSPAAAPNQVKNSPADPPTGASHHDRS